jgi:hypothetical protein
MIWKPTMNIFITGNKANDVQMEINETINKFTEWSEKIRLIINKARTTAISFINIGKCK